jgi:hypothetical protein
MSFLLYLTKNIFSCPLLPKLLCWTKEQYIFNISIPIIGTLGLSAIELCIHLSPCTWKIIFAAPPEYGFWAMALRWCQRLSSSSLCTYAELVRTPLSPVLRGKRERELPWLVAAHAPRALIYIHGVITGLLSLSHLIIFPHGPPPGNWTNFSRPCIQMREHTRCSECWARERDISQLTKSVPGETRMLSVYNMPRYMFWIYDCIMNTDYYVMP